MKQKRAVKLGIYTCAILIMGIIAVSSNIANIIQAFPDMQQTTIITYLISIPCLVIIPVTLLTGKLMGSISKKNLMLFGILCWLVGGCVPYFMTSLTPILVMRILFGIGVGMISTLCSALVVEYFEDAAERAAVMGNMTSFAMLGAVFSAVIAGNLGSIRWNLAFLMHLMALISLAGCLVCIPNKRPAGVTASGEKIKFRSTGMMWIWVLAFLIYMIAGQTYSNFASSIITEKGLGSSAAAGYSLSLFSLGGFVMGFIFGKIAKTFGRMTLTVGCALLAVSYLIMTFASSLAVSYLGAFICGLAFSICVPCMITGAADSVSQESSGMAVSLSACLQNAGMAISPYAVTPLAKAWYNSAGKLSANQYGMLVGTVIIAALGFLFAMINGKKDTSDVNG
jgi:MFS family permease